MDSAPLEGSRAIGLITRLMLSTTSRLAAFIRQFVSGISTSGRSRLTSSAGLSMLVFVTSGFGTTPGRRAFERRLIFHPDCRG